MKSNTFNYSLLAVGVAAVMGVSTGANAATPATAATAGAAPINNVATANYSVAGIPQPNVTSNTVTVNVSETANFALVSTVADGTIGDDTAINQTATPGGTTIFTHTLTNTGNVTDTYTVNTTGNDSPLVTIPGTPDYALGTASVTFTIVQADGTALTPAQVTALNGQAQTGSLTNGQTIRLQPGTRANLSYEATTPDNRNGNDKGVGTLTATSTFFTANQPANATLVNENQTIVRLPTFKIAKTATSTVDLTLANPQIAYGITVLNATNDYSAAATDFVIRDVLPAGMTLPNGTASVTASNGATVTTSVVNGRTVIDVAVANLAVGASQTISFTVNVSPAIYIAANSSATNNVEVYDKFVGPVGTLPATPALGTNYDILDSTNNTIDVTRVPAAADQANGAGVDSAGVTNFTKRAVVLSAPTTREIAPASGTAGQATQTTTITNNGQDTEGTNANPLTFTIADDGLNAAVRPVTGPVSVTYTPPGGGAAVITTIQPTVANGNTYTLNTTTLPGGIAPGGVLAINYKVSSGNVTTPATVADAAAVGSTETTTVTLTPAGVGAPAATTVTDTTNVRGLALVKTQSLDTTCSGTVASGTFVQTAINATPDQCVIYRIQATNTSSAALGFNLTALTISDLLSNFSAGADLVAGSPATSATTNSTAGTASTSATAVLGSNYTLVPQGVGTLTFKIKIKNAR